MRIKSKLFINICLTLCLVLAISGLAFAQPADIKGHWAEPQVKSWVEAGLAKGYPDGSFRPDASITRAEFMTMVNRAFGFNQSVAVSFSDVSSTDWFAGEIAKAKAAGYVSGYQDGTIKPNSQISRQEVASMLSRLMNLQTAGNLEAVNKLKDSGQVPQWSKAAINAVIAGGYMGGYPDQTFRPAKSITRAEAVVTLDRSKKAKQPVVSAIYDIAGVYGPATGNEVINGDVTVSVAGVTLQNMTINGKLLLDKGIGAGDVTLKNVTVKGETVIKGGGKNSIILDNCNMPSITVDKEGVRVVATGTTTVNLVTLASGATLVEVAISGPGFTQVTISQEVPKGAVITLNGSFTSVTVAANSVFVSIPKGASVATMTVNASANITGEGTIQTANINADGVTMQQIPTTVNAKQGVEYKVGVTPGGGGGGGGGGPSGTQVAFNGVRIDGATSVFQTGTINLSILPNTTMITGITVSATEGSSLKINSITSPTIGTLGYTPAREIPGLTVTADALLPGLIQDGDVSLGSLRGIFGSTVTVAGTLSKTGMSSRDVTIIITLGSGGGPVAIRWAEVTVNESTKTITAVIKHDHVGTSLAGLGLHDFFLDSVGKVPAWVSTSGSGNWRDPLVASDLAQLKLDIAALAGTSWNGATLGDLDGKTIYFKKNAGDTNEQKYTINFEV